MFKNQARGQSRQALLGLAQNYLALADVSESREDALILLLAACGIARADLLLDPQALAGDEAAALLAAFLERRSRGEPVTRILGRRAFWTLDLAVRPDVLDPRGDSEAVVRLALRLMVQNRCEPADRCFEQQNCMAPETREEKILDLGCGSGALLCALLGERRDATGFGVDLSPAACALTRENLGENGLLQRAFVIRGFWGAALAGKFDLIVSNPPYIRTNEIATLAPEVRNHDPVMALDGGADGLVCYRIILAMTRGLLSPDGIIVLELGAGQQSAVAAIALQQGYEFLGSETDYGGHIRAIAFKISRSIRES